MGYADLTSAKAQLDLNDDEPNDAADIALLEACDAAVAVTFEAKAGYDVAQSPIWGEAVTATATTRTINGEPQGSDILILPIPARSITDVQIVGAEPVTFDGSEWVRWHIDPLGHCYAIRRTDGYEWPRAGNASAPWLSSYLTQVEVEAVWANGPVGGAPPAIVVQACTFIVCDEYRTRNTSPAGQIGVEGLTIRPRNPWNFELVKEAIEAVRAPSVPVMF